MNTLKIKMFSLMINPCAKDINVNQFSANIDRLEHMINDWIKDRKHIVRDIKIEYITVERHNNGGCDGIMAVATVLYE